MNEINNIIANNIKKYRKHLDLTQEQFAELTELSWKTIVNIETGKHFPKAKNIEKICKKLNIEYFELFIDNQQEISKNCKLNQIFYILNNLDENKIENIYKIILTFKE